MKKLFLTAMTAVAMVGAANAATTWQFSGVDDPDCGYAYIFDESDANSIDDELQLYIESGNTKYYNSAMSTIKNDNHDSVSFNKGSGSGENGGFSSDNFYSIVFLDNSTKPTMYMVSDAVEYGWGVMDFNMSGSEWTPLSATPEPTSGLLMLVGLAGIALKRKRNQA